MKMVEWVLRLAIFGSFAGHGLIAIFEVPDKWLGYLSNAGFTGDERIDVLRVIGSIDLVIATSVVIKPFSPVLIYCMLWACATAMMAPISGEGILEFVERAPNFLAPLALLLLLRYQQKSKSYGR